MFATKLETKILTETYGENAQRIKACEELAELAQVVAVKANGIVDVDRNHYMEEVADVYNMLSQLCHIEGFTPDEIKVIARNKMDVAVAAAKYMAGRLPEDNPEQPRSQDPDDLQWVNE